MIRTVQIGSDITLHSRDPFTATLDGTTIKIHTAGRSRQFIAAHLPSWQLNAQFTLDGQPICLSLTC